MHYCPICRAKCDCPEQETKDLPFSTCSHCPVDDDDEFGPVHEFKPSRRQKILKALRFLDVLLTLVIVGFCFICGILMLFDREQMNHAVVILMLCCIFGALGNIYRKL